MYQLANKSAKAAFLQGFAKHYKVRANLVPSPFFNQKFFYRLTLFRSQSHMNDYGRS